MQKTIILLCTFLYAFSSNSQLPSFDGDKPEATFNAQYHQEFNPEAGWDSEKFYGYWHSHDPNIFQQLIFSRDTCSLSGFPNE
jgi:hypothetical protein